MALKLAVIEGKSAYNCRCWAIGEKRRNGFHVRKIMWGRLAAREEKREGETVIGARIILQPYDLIRTDWLTVRPK